MTDTLAATDTPLPDAAHYQRALEGVMGAASASACSNSQADQYAVSPEWRLFKPELTELLTAKRIHCSAEKR